MKLIQKHRVIITYFGDPIESQIETGVNYAGWIWRIKMLVGGWSVHRRESQFPTREAAIEDFKRFGEIIEDQDQ